MAKNDYLEFDLNNLPESFQCQFDGTTYNLLMYYNALTDNFYLDLNDENSVPIVQGEKLVYGMPVWGSINDPRLPMVNLVPLDDDNEQTEVSRLNFPNIIHLEIVEHDENVDDDSQDDSQPDINPYGIDPTNGGDD